MPGTRGPTAAPARTPAPTTAASRPGRLDPAGGARTGCPARLAPGPAGDRRWAAALCSAWAPDPDAECGRRYRLDGRMAVRIDVDAVRTAAGASVAEAADRLLAAGRLGAVEPVAGWRRHTVRNDPGPMYEVWVGVTPDGFTVECDCAEPATDGLCSHAVALTSTAVRDGFGWSASATRRRPLPVWIPRFGGWWRSPARCRPGGWPCCSPSTRSPTVASRPGF